MVPQVLAVLTPYDATLQALGAAAKRGGLDVRPLSPDPDDALSLTEKDGVAWYVPGGFAAALMARGTRLRLFGPTPEWFAGLPVGLTGRRLHLTDGSGAMALLEAGPRMVKLADGKRRGFSATWMASADDLRHMLATAALSLDVELLVGDAWLELDSEYRVFASGREVLTCSPYLVQGEGWSRDLSLHRASFHKEAASFVADALTELDTVPPCVVLDVGRAADGGYALIEANSPWSSGIYGCDPDAVLAAVLVSNHPASPGADDHWLWRPDPALSAPVS